MLSSQELHELYEGLKINSVNKYDYVLTGEGPQVLVQGSRQAGDRSDTDPLSRLRPCPSFLPGGSCVH